MKVKIQNFMICIMITIISITVEGCEMKSIAENSAILIDTKSDEKDNTFEIYYIDETEMKLFIEEVNHKFVDESEKNRIDFLIDKMLNKSKNNNIKQDILDHVKINKILYRKSMKKVEIDFSNEYEKLSSYEDILFRSAIVKTLTNLSEVEKVAFYMAGAPIINDNGQPIGPIGKDDVFTDLGQFISKSYVREYNIYLIDEKNNKLVPYEIQFEMAYNVTLEKQLLELLKKGISQDGIVSPISKSTEIRQLKIIDGICYLDLSDEFQYENKDSLKHTVLSVYGVVNTLTQLPWIEKIQFLIEGEVCDSLNSLEAFNQLFEKNYSY